MPSGVTINSASAGSAATAAGKAVSCSGNTCLVFGLNTTVIGNGVVATVDFQLSGSVSGVLPVNISSAQAATNVDPIPTTATGGSITVTAITPVLSGLSCGSGTIQTPGSLNCSVSLSSNAPAGFNVSLSDNNPNLSIPSAVTVQAGQNSASFTATGAQVAGDETATVTASAGGVTLNTTINLLSTASLTSLSCSPANLASGQSATCTAALSKAASAAATVTLSDTSNGLNTPSSVSIGAGQSSGSFNVTAGSLTENEAVTITAGLNGVTRTAQVNLVAPAGLNSLTCSPNSFSGPGNAACTVSLASAAVSNTSVGVSSNAGNVTVPANVMVLAGQSSAQFTAAVTSVSSDASVTITASLNGGTRTASLTLSAPASLTSLSCSPGSLSSGQGATCTVALSKASSGSTLVSLSDNTAQLTVPSSVTIANGQSSATFAATAGNISAGQTATITATQGAFVRTAQVNLVAPTGLNSLSCSPNNFSAPGTSTCTVGLASTASSNTSVTLSSSAGNVTVPSSVMVAAGQSSVQFAAAVTSVSSDATVTITASLNGGTQSAILSLSAPAVLTSLNCSPGSLNSGQSANCTAVLNKAAGGTLTLTLSDTSGQLTTPPSVSIGAGQSQGNFTVTAGSISTAEAVTVSAVLNGVTRTAQVNLAVAAGLSGLSCSPSTFNGAGSANCTVSLSSPAVSNVSISLSSNSGNVTVPANVSVAGGQSSGQFTATVNSVSGDSNVTITASLNGASQSATLSLNAGASLVSMNCSPGSLSGGQSASCTVTLSKTGPNASTISLADNSSQLTTPASVIVEAGQSQGTFAVTAEQISAAETAIITGTLNGVSRTAQLSLVAPAGLSSLTCAPTALGAGESALCTVGLVAPASQSTVITLGTNSDSVAVAPSVTIPVGQSSAQVRVNIPSNAPAGNVVVTASLGGGSLTSTLTIGSGNAAPDLVSVNCSPNTLKSGQSAACTVTLSRATGTALVVNLASNNTALTVPSTFQLAANASSGTFNALAGEITSAGGAVISATLNGATVSTTVGLEVSVGQPALQSFSCATDTLASGTSSTCTATFSGQASTTAALQIGSSSALINVPSQLTVQAGQNSVTFPIQASSTSTEQNVSLTATWAGSQRTQTIRVTAADPLSFELPTAVFTRVGVRVSFEVKLTRTSVLGARVYAQSLPDGATFSGSRFQWTPRDMEVGEHQVVVRVEDAAGPTKTATVRVVVREAEPVITGFVNPAGFTPVEECSPNALVTFLGKGFSLNDPSVGGFPVPTELGGVRIRINNSYAPLLYVSDDMIHFQCPDLAPGTGLEIVLEYEKGVNSQGNPATAVASVLPIRTKMSAASPGIFVMTGNNNQGAVLVSGTAFIAGPPSPAYTSKMATPGDYIEIYANGMGPVTESLPAGQPAPLDRLIRSTASVVVDFGDGLKVPAAFAGLTPGSVGLFQVNVQLPPAIGLGPAVPLTIEIQLQDGSVVRSNTVTIGVAR